MLCTHFSSSTNFLKRGFDKINFYHCTCKNNFVLRWIGNIYLCVCSLKMGSSLGLDFIVRTKRFRCKCYKNIKMFCT